MGEREVDACAEQAQLLRKGVIRAEQVLARAGALRKLRARTLPLRKHPGARACAAMWLLLLVSRQSVGAEEQARAASEGARGAADERRELRSHGERHVALAAPIAAHVAHKIIVGRRRCRGRGGRGGRGGR